MNLLSVNVANVFDWLEFSKKVSCLFAFSPPKIESRLRIVQLTAICLIVLNEHINVDAKEKLKSQDTYAIVEISKLGKSMYNVER